jgi:hypothetical protein
VSSLTDALSSATTGSGEPCKLCVTIEGLKPEDRAAVQRSLAAGISDEALWTILSKNGHRTPRRHIRDHKKEGHK